MSSDTAPTTEKHPVDQTLPFPQMFTYGLQHVLSMYAGVVAVPLIVGTALQAQRPRDHLPGLGRPVHLRVGHAPADPRRVEVRRPAADRAGHLVRRRVDHPRGRHRAGRRGRSAGGLRRPDRRRPAGPAHRTGLHPAAALLPRGGHRHWSSPSSVSRCSRWRSVGPPAAPAAPTSGTRRTSRSPPSPWR